MKRLRTLHRMICVSGFEFDLCPSEKHSLLRLFMLCLLSGVWCRLSKPSTPPTYTVQYQQQTTIKKVYICEMTPYIPIRIVDTGDR